MKTTFFTLICLLAFSLYSCTNAPKQEDETEIVVEEETPDEIQVLDPVKLDYNAEKIADNHYKITFNANIDEHWYVYSNNIADDGPIPTTINYDENEIIDQVENVEESGVVEKDGYDELFDMDIKKFGTGATFSQVFTTKGTGTVTGYLEYMTCDSIQCLFPDPIEFTIDVE